jgi:hypothetical protein
MRVDDSSVTRITQKPVEAPVAAAHQCRFTAGCQLRKYTPN